MDDEVRRRGDWFGGFFGDPLGESSLLIFPRSSLITRQRNTAEDKSEEGGPVLSAAN